MGPYFESMALARGVAWGENVEPAPHCALVKLADMEIHVDLAGLIDVIARKASSPPLASLVGVIVALSELPW